MAELSRRLISVFQESTLKSGRWTWTGRRSSFRFGEQVLVQMDLLTKTKLYSNSVELLMKDALTQTPKGLLTPP